MYNIWLAATTATTKCRLPTTIWRLLKVVTAKGGSLPELGQHSSVASFVCHTVNLTQCFYLTEQVKSFQRLASYLSTKTQKAS